MCRLLDAARVSYVFQANMYDVRTGRIYIADFRIRRASDVRPKGLPRREWKRDERKVFVEIDGSSHEGRALADARRTRWMEAHRHAVVLRFTNDDVWRRPQMILEAIGRYRPAIRYGGGSLVPHPAEGSLASRP